MFCILSVYVLSRKNLSFLKEKDEEKRKIETGKALGGLLEGALDEGEAAFGLLAEHFFFVGEIRFEAVKLVGDRQGCKDREFLRVHDAGGFRDRMHFFVHVFGELLDVPLFEFAADGVDLAEDLDFYGCAHGAEL